MDTTITEHDMDASARQFVNNIRQDRNLEPDLAVDGLSESLLARIAGLFGVKRN